MTRAQLIELEAFIANTRANLAEIFQQATDAHANHLLHPSILPLLRQPADAARLQIDEALRVVRRSLNTTPAASRVD